MEEPCPILEAVCTACGHNQFRFVGFQWMRISTIMRMGGTPHLVDPEKPEQAAVRFYVCIRCKNGHIEF
jgi:hypothetical protein